MSELRVVIDPLNPGQFLACCGLFELMATNSDVLARFELREEVPRRGEFILTGSGLSSLPSLIEGLQRANLQTVDKVEASVRPVSLGFDGRDLILDWWLDEFWDHTTSFKCWAGQVTTRKLFADLLPLLDPSVEPDRIFDSRVMAKSKFGVDPRSAWNALDFGFSPDAHQRDAATYPAVEVLAAVGLQGFRPPLKQRRGSYFLWTVDLPPSVARLAAVAGWDGLPSFMYTFSIAKRGQSYKYFEFARFVERNASYEHE